MSISKAETMKVIGHSFINVGEAMEKDSDGGEKVTTGEIIDITTDTIQKTLEELRDDDDK